MKKELYVATNIEDLNKLVQKDFKNFKAENLFKSAETLFRTGLGHLQDGDEERAYIFYVRFILIYEYLQKLKDDKGYAKKRLGREYNTISEQLEKLKLSLTERYNDNKNVQDLPPQIIPQSTGDTKSTTIEYPKEYISCSELFSLLQKKIDIVILDARSADHYRQSCMKGHCCVNIPEEMIKSGSSANVLGKDVPNESRSQWDKRWSSALTILMDWSSTKDTITASKLSVLKDILVNWDLMMNNSNPPVVLSGGYLEWLQIYPMYCTNPDIVHTVQNSALNDLLDLDIIEYPMTEINEHQKQMPVVDRATKPKLLNMDIKHSKEESDYAVQDMTKTNFAQVDENVRTDLEYLATKFLTDQRTLDKNNEINNRHIVNNEVIVISSDSEDETEKVDNKKNIDLSVINDIEKTQNIEPHNEKHRHDMERLLIEAREKKKPLPRHLKPAINLRPQKPARYARKIVIPRTGKNSGPGLTGLVNISNSCYMNASVQCLSNTGPILFYFLNKEFVKDINPNEGTCGYVARAFGNMIQKIWSGTQKTFTPRDMRNAVIQFAPRYNGSQHQDAHEFVITLSNWLHEDLRREMVRPLQVIWTPKEKSYIQQTEGKSSVILQTFCGQIQNSIFCEACWKTKEKYEIFENLTLALPSDAESCTLESCIQSYFNKQPIIGYKCPQCSCQTQIYQQGRIVSHPPVLVFQLKRFSERISAHGVTYERNNIEVNFPLKKSLYIFQRQYKLYATVNHRGTLDMGHYYAACKNPVTEYWYQYDDTYVNEINEAMVDSPSEVYMLYYQTVEEEQRTKNLFSLG